MMTPLQISFHQMESSEALEGRIRDHVAKLETFCQRITSCRVSVEEPHRRHQHGNHFRVRVDIVVPGDELVVARDPEQRSQNEDVHQAIDGAFKEAERQLKEYVRRRRNDVKSHVDV